jgi:shikimate kinase
MSAPNERSSASQRGLFDHLPHTPLQHFALYFYAALLRVLTRAARHYDSAQAARKALPYLDGYLAELNELGIVALDSPDVCASWRDAMLEWESAAPCRLPLTALRHAGRLSQEDLTLLVQIGLPDEDPRLGHAFDVLQGGVGERRATLALLAASWPPEEGFDARAATHRLSALGLVEPSTGDNGGVRPCAAAWDALRGSVAIACTWMRHRAADQLPEFETLVLPDRVRAEAGRVPSALASGAASVIVLRGPRHNGRSTLAGALAARMGKTLIEVPGLEHANDARWRTAAAVACLLDAAILVSGSSTPSEAFALPDIEEGMAPLFVTLGNIGGLSGALADRAITLRIPVPDADARAALWRAALDAEPAGMERRRMTSGNIVRAARLARAARNVSGSTTDIADALRAAVRTLERPALEQLARWVEPSGEWSHLAVQAETMTDLATLAARCRQRERLGAVVGTALGGMGPGVRALFKGPSGTGKTLAARLLAGRLGMDLYRVDLAAVVNKYIGETEKNLERVFACAEELDVVLLLDEGDAVLTQRTSVRSANDRYANLETDYLLQRLESYEGILLVTTNASDRIDSAFQRRMDMVIDFPLPGASERWSIWQLHLPGTHDVDPSLLDATAQRCELSGGQIRNVALHASLLALESDEAVGSLHLETAIEREYRRQGALSPLRARSGVR